jgi:phospholipid transport system transporter-binding protein
MQHKLSGRLDMGNCANLAKELTQALHAPLELDFSDVSAADSACLALILELRRQAAKQGQPLTLHNLPAGLNSLALLYGLEILPTSSERVSL